MVPNKNSPAAVCGFKNFLIQKFLEAGLRPYIHSSYDRSGALYVLIIDIYLTLSHVDYLGTAWRPASCSISDVQSGVRGVNAQPYPLQLKKPPERVLLGMRNSGVAKSGPARAHAGPGNLGMCLGNANSKC